MADFILPGEPPVVVRLRRSKTARRYSLRVSRLDGRVTLTMPPHAPEKQALEFAAEKADWIRNGLSDRPSQVLADIGETIPVEGEAFTITRGARSGIVHDSAEITVSRRIRSVPASVGAVLKELARQRLTEASDRYADALGRSYGQLTLRDTRSRWGSCSSNGKLMYSWRLILAPPEVLQYVAAHEVAHLVEMNHSSRFWGTVEQISPDYAGPRAWLRKHGEELHRFVFTD